MHHALHKYHKDDLWAEHPGASYNREAWREQVAAENTQLGYWEWASDELEEADVQHDSNDRFF